MFEQYCLETSQNQTIKFSDYKKFYPSVVDGEIQTINSTESSYRCHLHSAIFSTEFYNYENRSFVCSPYIEICKILIDHYNCSLTFILPEEDFGGYYVNGTFTGILKLISEKVADFIPHFFSIHSNRDQVLDNTILSNSAYKVSIVSHQSYIPNTNPLQIFHTFTWEIWLLLFTGFICYTILLMVADLIINDQNLSTNRLFDFNFILFRTLIGQSLSKFTLISKQRKAIHLLRNSLLIWILATLLLRQLFSNDVVASLLAKREQIIDHFVQLVENKDYRIMVVSKSSTEKIFLSKFPQLKYRSFEIDHEITAPGPIVKLMKGKHVLIVDRWKGYMLKEMYRKFDLHVSKEKFGLTFSSLAIRKNLHSSARIMLAKMFQQIHQNGIINKLNGDRYNYQLNLKLIQKKINKTIEYEDDNGTRQLAAIDKELTDAHMEDDQEYLNHRIMSLIYIHILGLTFYMVLFELIYCFY
ncbi:hypothetical protein HUG17_2146 [Dermatophagoides farinae]|uniref:Uncharacterized protein n=1 Tax=Dermatophagoides farinae TaxID=6954 RepID=A0A9D4P9L9_DERFA|nr:uncharacterized protein LOC124498857 [Dermatophagoides farinae]KAH7646608.1 hypothetical protein HUG17_2146 [Dermatophagoides farinae]